MPSPQVMKATLQAYVDRYNAGDVAGLVELFAPDARIEDPIGSPVQTRDQFARVLADGVAYGARLTRVAPIRGLHGNEAALVFEVEFTPPGGPRTRIRSIDACRFDTAGRIVELRAYWGPDDMETMDG
jgi:steroid delta-isomerase